MRRRRLLIVVPILGLAACAGSTGSSMDASVNLTQPTGQVYDASGDILDTTAGQIKSMDLVWPSKSQQLCPAFRDAIPKGQHMRPGEKDFVVASFEQGFHHKLTPEAQQHLFDLLESCP